MNRHRTAFTRVSSLQTDPASAQVIHRILMRLFLSSSDESWAELASRLREQLYPASLAARLAAMSSPLRFL